MTPLGGRIWHGARSAASALASSERREQLRRERFWRNAHRYTRALEAEDRRGSRFIVSTGDQAVGRELFARGEFDPQVIEKALEILARAGFEPGQLIDVGANIGTVTVDVLARFPQATAVAFEPDELNLRLLRQNLVGNGIEQRVVAHGLAIGDSDGPVVLELATDNFGDHRVRVGSVEGGGFGEHRRVTRTVPGRRLDALLEQDVFALDRPTLMWVDVQGHEAHVLAGAARLREIPVVLEVWPYGLRRAGGLERLTEALASWPAVFDVRRQSVVERSQLGSFLAAVEARPVDPFTDVLLLPQSLAGALTSRASPGR